MRTPRRRRVFSAAVILGILAIVAGAYAYWTATGSGAGAATTADPGAQTVTVNQTSTSNGLYPGGSVALSGNFDNPAANAVHVGNVTATVTGTNKVGCNASDYSVGGTATIANGGSVLSGTAVGGWSGLTLSMADTASNQDACKGATVSIAYSAG